MANIYPNPLYTNPLVTAKLPTNERHIGINVSLDLQVNGFSFKSQNKDLSTVDFSNPNLTEEDVRHAALAVYLSGATFFLATIVTSDEETLIHNAKIITKVMQEDIGKGILGIHFEGPSIDTECKGAHKKEIIEANPPTIHFWETIYNACSFPDNIGDNSMVMVTISPNYDTSAETIKWLTNKNVVVSLGHFRAKSWEHIEKALEAGATGLTHIGNAWSIEDCGLSSKYNPYGTLMGRKETVPMFIGDLIHLKPFDFQNYLDQILRTTTYNGRLKRPVLVSDLSPLAGAPEGTLGPDIFHGLTETPKVELQNGELRTTPLTGSCHTQSQQALKLTSAKFDFFTAVKILASAYNNPFELIAKNLKGRGWKPDINHLRRCFTNDIGAWQRIIITGKADEAKVNLTRIHKDWARSGFSITSLDEWLTST